MDREKKKMVILLALGGVVILGFLVFAFTVVLGGGEKSKEVAPVESARPVFPDATEGELYEDKSRAYSESDDSGRDKDIEDIWGSLASKEGSGSESGPGLTEKIFGVDSEGKVVDERKGTGKRPASSSASRSGDTGLITSTSSTASSQRPSLSASGRRQSSSSSSAASKPAVREEPEEKTYVDSPKASSRPQSPSGWNSTSTGVISSLTGSQPASEPEWDSSDERMIRCCFAKDQKITGEQRITVRLLEDLYMDDILIPANTRLTAMCTLSNRLNIEINGFDLNGRIIPGSFLAYDKNDGNLGIYCTANNDRNARSVKRAALSQGTSLASKVVSAGGGLIGSIASSAIGVGSSIASDEVSLVEVNVPAGYEFYLKKNTRTRR